MKKGDARAARELYQKVLYLSSKYRLRPPQPAARQQATVLAADGRRTERRSLLVDIRVAEEHRWHAMALQAPVDGDQLFLGVYGADDAIIDILLRRVGETQSSFVGRVNGLDELLLGWEVRTDQNVEVARFLCHGFASFSELTGPTVLTISKLLSRPSTMAVCTADITLRDLALNGLKSISFMKHSGYLFVLFA